MGCDIHLFLEQKAPGEMKWRYVKVFDNCEVDSRNYPRFALLAGVRGAGPAAIGLPVDMSPEVAEHAAGWGADGHSHSHGPLDAALPIFMQTCRLTEISTLPNVACWQLFGIVPQYANQFRLVFWFDN